VDIEKVKEIFKKDGFDLVRTRGRLIALFLFPDAHDIFLRCRVSGHISGVNILVTNHAATSPEAWG